jgi:DNA-damage-inducible protein D
MENAITPFEGNNIRKVWHEEHWYFVLDDVLVFLTETNNPKAYWSNLRRKDEELKKGYGKIYSTLFVGTEGGRQKMNCANTEGILRIIMSISSPRVEPLKRWLAQVGSERIQETENPELGFERLTALYKAKGYDDAWIESRLKSIGIRKELTDEWQKRGVKQGEEYAILTAEIAKMTFGLTPSEHAKLKGLKKENLRDHMTNLELLFAAIGEEVTRIIVVKEDAQGFEENHDAATKGGKTAGEALKRIEKTTGERVVSSKNFLKQVENEENKELPPHE